MFNRHYWLQSMLLVFLSTGAAAQAELGTADKSRRTREKVYARGVVAADHPLASEAGAEILRQGGNVVDAAVATSFALSVVRPASCGIGGGGFMVIWNAQSRQGVALDYRERAPAAATRDLFVDPDNPRKPLPGDLSRKGALAVAVPGTVSGLCYALEHYGTLKLPAVLQPALRLTRSGVLLDRFEREAQTAVLDEMSGNRNDRQRFRVLRDSYLNRGDPWRERDRFYSPQLEVLKRIAEYGADGFYHGPVAEALVAEVQRGGGLLTRNDLAETKPVVREPLLGQFDGFHVVTMPPPSSGGVALIESLNMLSAYEKQHANRPTATREHNSAGYVHLLAEILKHAFADRAEFMGDPDFTPIPVKRLTSPEYAAELASRINDDKTQPLETYGRFLPVEDGGTSHICVIDRKGNAVACTETINTRFGSLVVEPKYGIVLNNEMDDFAAVPEQPNAFGLMQSEANAVGPKHKPLSSMTPTILVKDGRAVFALGASGGPRIISATLQVLLNMTRFRMTPKQSVAAARIHHQWVPDELGMEPTLFDAEQVALEQLQHRVTRRENLAAVQAVSRDLKGLHGGSDPRKGGQVAGY